MSKCLFTIGYAGIKLLHFIEVLKENKITFLIDVRSTPKSQYFADFNDTKLKTVLAENGIKYENWKAEFGARQEDKNFYTDNILDFEKFGNSRQFKSGIDKAKQLSEIETICLMCAEIDPLVCHRAILCGKELSDNGFDIQHIIARRNSDIRIENHKDLEKRLAGFLDLQTAYKKQNKKIGYKISQ